jgi:hypothetical protein
MTIGNWGVLVVLTGSANLKQCTLHSSAPHFPFFVFLLQGVSVVCAAYLLPAAFYNTISFYFALIELLLAYSATLLQHTSKRDKPHKANTHNIPTTPPSKSQHSNQQQQQAAAAATTVSLFRIIHSTTTQHNSVIAASPLLSYNRATPLLENTSESSLASPWSCVLHY